MTQESQKLTAVEWLIEQMKNGSFESWHTKNKWNISYHAQEKTLEIAKAMEKEQIVNADLNATIRTAKGFNADVYVRRVKELAEQYYNQTYNK